MQCHSPTHPFKQSYNMCEIVYGNDVVSILQYGGSMKEIVYFLKQKKNLPGRDKAEPSSTGDVGLVIGCARMLHRFVFPCVVGYLLVVGTVSNAILALVHQTHLHPPLHSITQWCISA